ncbi:cytochrome P450 family protein [Nocardiopsis valliformis]|uniref:cytochrome P450 family protein n=1 Tax=Nocardiopsis valliformis TaxID=239974 RepID=UPI00034C49F7|nr:cytochrome P450 [Nocardiopsis valliformis]
MTTHAAVSEALTHPGVRKDKRHWRAWREGRIPMEWPLISWVISQNMMSSDGGDHTRLRGLVSKAFTPRRVEDMRGGVVDLVESLLDDLGRAAAESADGTVDIKAGLAEPLSVAVISELFGVDEGVRPELGRLVGITFDQSVSPEETMAAYGAMEGVLTELVAARRARPGDDLTSALIAARDREDRLSEQELLWTLVLLLGAGFETTMNLLTNAVRALATHRDQLDLLTSGKAEWSRAVEEVLRWDGPAGFMPLRYTAEEVELSGARIPAGEALLLAYVAAGRDEARHGPTAAVFDLTREDTAHLGFARGRHFCLGASLARMEVGEALPRLFARYPGLELAGEPQPQPSFVAVGVEALPVRLAAGV